MWRTINDNNAIEAVGLSIRFVEPIGSLPAKRILADLEDPARKAGLTEKQPVQEFQVQINQRGANVQPTPSFRGMSYSRQSLERTVTGAVELVLTKQLVFQPTQLLIQNFRYERWHQELAGAMALISPALATIANTVAIAAIRLEYVDRFIFEGSPAEARVDDLLDHSDWLAPHTFTAPDLWHSHTGRFADYGDQTRRLYQVNADMQELVPPHPQAGSRTLSLMTAVEQQFRGLGLEMSDPQHYVSGVFSELHDVVHDVFRGLLNPAFVEANGLGNNAD